jgi:hypothetical protein
MATQKSTAHPAHPSTEDQDERPCACNDGWVTLGQIVIDSETGEEAEEYALYLCRRCAEEARACYEPGRKPHRNADSTVALVPVRSPFPAFLRHF